MDYYNTQHTQVCVLFSENYEPTYTTHTQQKKNVTKNYTLKYGVY